MIKEKIQLEKIRRLMSDISDSIEAIEEYGYVGNYDITDEELNDVADKVIFGLEEANIQLDNINGIIREQFEH
jgi:hypothetical protein